MKDSIKHTRTVRKHRGREVHKLQESIARRREQMENSQRELEQGFDKLTKQIETDLGISASGHFLPKDIPVVYELSEDAATLLEHLNARLAKHRLPRPRKAR